MTKWLFSATVCASIMLLSSCSKKQGQPQVAAPEKNASPAPLEVNDDAASRLPQGKADPKPSLMIESVQVFPLGTGTKATIWNLRGRKVKELSALLLVCTNGKADRNRKIDCRWDDGAESIHGQLIFLVQDGQPFGVKGKYLPSLSLSFQSGGPTSRSEAITTDLIPSDRPSHSWRTRSSAGSISGRDALHVEFPAPLKNVSQFSISSSGEVNYKGKGQERSFNVSTDEGLLESSKDGGSALAVIVEWKQ